MAALAFPFVGGAGAMVNRLSDRTAQDSAQLLEGDVPVISTMVDAEGNPIAWIFTQRRWAVPGNRIADTMKLAIVSIEDKRFGAHNGVDLQGSLTGLAGYLQGRGRHPRRFDHRAAVRQELQLPGERPERRGAPGRHRDHTDPQAARDADGARARQGASQGGDPDPLSEPGVVRQRQLRRAGRREDVLRSQRGGPQLAAVGAAGGDGAVDEHAQPVHQSRGGAGTPQPGARHPDSESPGQGCRAPEGQGGAAGHPGRSPRRCRRAVSGRATARSSATTRCPISPAPGSPRTISRATAT